MALKASSNNTALAFGGGTNLTSSAAPINSTATLPSTTSANTKQAYSSGLNLTPTSPNGDGSTTNPGPAGNGPGKGASTRPRSIADIKTQILQPATTSHFICKFQPPAPVDTWQKLKEPEYAGAPYNSINSDLIEISCSEASLPGSTLATHDANNDYHGVSQKMAYRRLYDDRADFTFYVDTRYTVIRFFEGWITYIVNEQQANGFTDNNYYYRMNYPVKYKTDTLIITKFEKNTGRPDVTPPLEYVFLEAFPISINSMPVTYDQSQLLKCTVSFSFSRYFARVNATSKDSSIPDPKNPGNPESNGTGKEFSQVYGGVDYSSAYDLNSGQATGSRKPFSGSVGDFQQTPGSMNIA
jgi:hypothetical protein